MLRATLGEPHERRWRIGIAALRCECAGGVLARGVGSYPMCWANVGTPLSGSCWEPRVLPVGSGPQARLLPLAAINGRSAVRGAQWARLYATGFALRIW